MYGPGDEGYDERRRALNPAVEHRPVVEALGAADVRVAVEAARQQTLPIAVQATDHGTHAAVDGGTLLRPGGMAAVLVDLDRRTARVGPGARWAQVLAAAAPFDLSPISGSSPPVGVTGYTLGGDMGWLARRYGLAGDSVVRADVVTADGRLVTATADRNPDQFWALRGGGGNFGVVKSLEFRLHPVPSVAQPLPQCRVQAVGLVAGDERDGHTVVEGILDHLRSWWARSQMVSLRGPGAGATASAPPDQEVAAYTAPRPDHAE